MNIEPRFSGPIIQSASTLLGHAITAKVAKMDKKLKMIDLQLKKAKLDQNVTDPADKAVEGKGMIIDRSELLNSIIAQSQKTDK
jgi:galactitol-specific phosphotransferase system IIB component